MRESRLNMLKLCVGADTVEDLRRWQAGRVAAARKACGDARPRHVTRMWPRRADEILAGGSLYWVFRGLILARQRIVAFDEADLGDGIRRCGIVLSPDLVLTEARPKRAFQGWRYLPSEEAPPDLAAGADAAADLPGEMRAELARLGVM